MRTVFVGQNKGGVGKTTISLNLAACAHVAGMRVLIIDADDQKSAFMWKERQADASPLAGIVVVSAPAALSLPKLRTMSAGYDVVIIDGPPRAEGVSRAAAVAADVVLVPYWPGPLDVWASKKMMLALDDANTMRASIGMPSSRRVLVVNGVVSRDKSIADYTLDGVKDEGEIAPVTVGNRITYPKATAEGEALATMYPGSAGAREIEALWMCVGGEA